MAAEPVVVTYPTRFGDGWVAFEGEEVRTLGLPGMPCPYGESGQPPSSLATNLAAGLARYWNGGALPRVTDVMVARASRTELDEHIYSTVRSIVAGTTMTYAAVAARVGRPGAARAVGAAMAANRLAPMIPCHRVVGSDGSLRGYAGGLEMKRYLLDLEAECG